MMTAFSTKMKSHTYVTCKYLYPVLTIGIHKLVCCSNPGNMVNLDVLMNYDLQMHDMFLIMKYGRHEEPYVISVNKPH